MCILGRCTSERHPAVMGAAKIYSLLERMRRVMMGRDARASRVLTGIVLEKKMTGKHYNCVNSEKIIVNENK